MSAAKLICGGPALGPAPAWPPPLGSPGAGGISRPLLPTLPPVNSSPSRPGGIAAARRARAALERQGPSQLLGGEGCGCSRPSLTEHPGSRHLLQVLEVAFVFQGLGKKRERTEKLSPFTKRSQKEASLVTAIGQELGKRQSLCSPSTAFSAS